MSGKEGAASSRLVFPSATDMVVPVGVGANLCFGKDVPPRSFHFEGVGWWPGWWPGIAQDAEKEQKFNLVWSILLKHDVTGWAKRIVYNTRLPEQVDIWVPVEAALKAMWVLEGATELTYAIWLLRQDLRAFDYTPPVWTEGYKLKEQELALYDIWGIGLENWPQPCLMTFRVPKDVRPLIEAGRFEGAEQIARSAIADNDQLKVVDTGLFNEARFGVCLIALCTGSCWPAKWLLSRVRKPVRPLTTRVTTRAGIWCRLDALKEWVSTLPGTAYNWCGNGQQTRRAILGVVVALLAKGAYDAVVGQAVSDEISGENGAAKAFARWFADIEEYYEGKMRAYEQRLGGSLPGV